MKKIFIFDLDNTVNSTKQKKVLPQTEKLIKKLASMPDTYLGIATGRPLSKVYLDKEFLNLFTYKILINGALVYKQNELIYENPINKQIVKKMLKIALSNDLLTGFVGGKSEYISKFTDKETLAAKKIYDEPELAPKNIEEIDSIYQFWVFTEEKSKYLPYLLEETKLRHYSWHSGGFDLVNQNTNKANAIREILKNEKDYQLIAIGDGHNDIEMIEMADIGIAMGNSGFDELKEKADFIAPHIEQDQLYDFFKSIKLIF